MNKLLKPVNFIVCLVIMTFMMLTYHRVNQFSTGTFFLAGFLYLGMAGLVAYLASDGPLNKFITRTNNRMSTMIMLVVFVTTVQMMFNNLTAMPLAHFALYGALLGIAVNLDSQYIQNKQQKKK